MMSKDNHEEKPKLTDTWRSIHGGIWLIGLAILFWKGWWWPGILVLLAVSGIAETLIRQYVPDAVEKTERVMPAAASATQAASHSDQRLEFLPTTCPNCGGPIRGHEVKWTGPQSADCPYCGVNLPMKK
jgi:predicted Zn-ribbon and HTH transcriptional regulator